jgi:hypothetical protein
MLRTDRQQDPNFGLPAKFWSAALLHAVYLHNRLVHSSTGRTLYEGWHGCKPDVTHLKTFGSCVCMKMTGTQRCKLDQHTFTGIFLGYTATFVSINSPVLQPPVSLVSPFTVAWPPLANATSAKTWECPCPSLFVPLPLQVTEAPNVLGAAAALIQNQQNHSPVKIWPQRLLPNISLGLMPWSTYTCHPTPTGNCFKLL